MANPTIKKFLRCPACGHAVGRRQLTRGALGHSLQALTQEFVGRPYGTNGGAWIWKKRRMNRLELEHVGRCIATAVEIVMSELEDHTPPVSAEEIIASEPDEKEAGKIGHDWIQEAIREALRREQVVEAAMKRRRGIVE